MAVLGRYFERVSPGRVTQPRTAPSQPSPAQPSPGRTFPTFLGRNVVWRVAGPGQPGTGHHHHHTSHCLTQTHTVSSQGDGTCSHPPQRIKQFSFVRRFLGPVDMLIITLDKTSPLAGFNAVHYSELKMFPRISIVHFSFILKQFHYVPQPVETTMNCNCIICTQVCFNVRSAVRKSILICILGTFDIYCGLQVPTIS